MGDKDEALYSDIPKDSNYCFDSLVIRLWSKDLKIDLIHINESIFPEPIIWPITIIFDDFFGPM